MVAVASPASNLSVTRQSLEDPRCPVAVAPGGRHVERLAPGVFHIDTYPFNWYVIEEAGRLTLVDSGWPGHEKALVDGLAQMGKTTADIEAVVLTHAHADHVGMAGVLAQRQNIPVFVHEADRGMASRILQLPWAGLLGNAWRHHMAFNMLGHAVFHGLLRERGIDRPRTMVDGERLDVPGRPRVVHVPGHTAGEVVLVLEDRGVLISGDTIVTENMRTGQPGGPQFPHVSLNGQDADARRAIGRVAELGRMKLLPGHGRPWEGDVADAVAIARGERW
jgi:glyoxylase-like metal-dependent hydrolase (beta-lactamase superfamily II)